jgi:hypothetical protein
MTTFPYITFVAGSADAGLAFIVIGVVLLALADEAIE